ncbi:hypothetical protein LTR56_018917 [Elasticomyces elasticus]|nr:hypothetical protein LTR56_018917 [Elasticomyces elasticus]KAK3649856.1 hypothetical protein LTR22_012732 [Elasticomyces elasticus]KAK4918193.1 hypothetical protein LTR49_014049 [Elasticomyces elasticus]KAK5757739.1 hypothetical protein LTS12_012198 [Elasticomyces elasticus]
MADIAFGVVGVAGLAIQLADSVKKLRAFAALVKDAPSELRELIEYIDISRQWLDSISTTPVAAMDPALTLRCEGLCRKAVDRLAIVARELEQGMQTKKRRTALKLAWTTDALERLRKRLDSSKVDLHNAHSMFVAEQVRTEISTEGRRVRDTMVDLNSEAHARHQDLTQGVAKVQSGQMVMEQMITTGQHGNQQNFIHLGCELQMSLRTQQQGFLSVQTGQKNLHHSLNTAQTQSQEDARMQTTLLTGHIDTGQAQTMSRIEDVLNAVQALRAAVTHDSVNSSQVFLSPHAKHRRQAGDKRYTKVKPYRLRLLSNVVEISISRAIAGWDFSMRTYRIMPAHNDVWDAVLSDHIVGLRRALNDRTMSPYDRTTAGWSLIDLLTTAWYCDLDTLEELYDLWTASDMPLSLGTISDNTIYRLWSIEGAYDPPLEAGALVRTWINTPNFTAELPEDVVDMLGKQPSTWTTEERLELLIWTDGSGVMVLDILVGLESISSKVATSYLGSGFTMLYALASAYNNSHTTLTHCLQLDRILRTCVHMGADLYATRLDCDSGATPLTMVVAGHSSLEASTRSLQRWIRSLCLAGVDLELYGRAQMGNLHRMRNEYSDRYRFVAYGPDVVDWQVFDLHHGDVYAGCFWYMIEHPELGMPGAWLEHEDVAIWNEDHHVADKASHKRQRKEYGAKNEKIRRAAES